MKGTTDFTLTLLYLLKPSFDYHWHVSCEKIGLLWSDLAPGGGTWVFLRWVCAARDSKLAPRSRKNFP